jgi:proline dehydrogenase
MATSDNPSLEEMWRVIEHYGIKRESLDQSNITEKTVSRLYQMIKKNREIKRDHETIQHLKEYIEKKKIGNLSTNR